MVCQATAAFFHKAFLLKESDRRRDLWRYKRASPTRFKQKNQLDFQERNSIVFQDQKVVADSVSCAFYEVVIVKLQIRRRVNLPGRWIGLAILEIGNTTIHPACIFCSRSLRLDAGGFLER